MNTALDRRAAVQALLQDRGDLLVISGLGSSSYDVFAAGDHPANFYLWGAMGGAAMMGLGLALAQPSRPVAVITGDGEQLMGLGGLATAAAKKPSNLSIIVLDNAHFGETGMQMSHSGLGARLELIASGAGFPSVSTIADQVALDAFRPKLHDRAGPHFARVVISTDHVDRALPPRDGVFLKNRFRGHLGYPVS
ncbi:MAG: thiamine pyrophosphate-dependent enzyme [Bradyrhizobium sp.]|jgi:thiamine pyrophosphate-dependent acetolactate synthase large subunit-like protein|uniref:Aldehyde dehydrogenase n=3 Tax=Bradyrhizobium TaxID=374 RepID=A0ABS5GDB9_9BRAD|nr:MULTISPECIES: thiamine pyrophosphate-dependent enzyme [Bradyrhizobium]MBR1139326.1 aldehyde dehydrogenase [Bradyrhizobium denitrificans]MDU1495263.1 thiamine pyrophosphate-dependent enzyme [Bradyrhizobium sp.]MDU1545350.1 thiamine pyrophosphate-dependent enzyme [Bradyrhizobium sp.]MDU1667093.1 thiamine pyrophosphate-dependent enzyme [Bradyrhizobium sp.]MDU1807812.1 thiamine pyrophosphate-dependent enzyme [Bradyrhizobium sp.]